MDNDYWIVVGEEEVAEEFGKWVEKKRLNLGGKDRQRLADRLSKNWVRLMRQLKKQGKLGALFREFPSAGGRPKLYGLRLRIWDRQNNIASLEELLDRPDDAPEPREQPRL
jgi:hypothetical protein